MSQYLFRRLLQGFVSLLGVVTMTFFLLQLTGDPASTLLPANAGMDELIALRHELGLDRPLSRQFVDFLVGIPGGDLGRSFHLRESAAQLVRERLPSTLLLAFSSLGLALLIAIPLGLAAAYYRNSWIDYLSSSVSFLGFAVPSFWLGTITILIFGVRLGWLPTSGYGSPVHLILPAATLALWAGGQLTVVIRSDVLGVLREDYIRTARAKGLPERTILLSHAFRNATIGLVTLVGLTFGPLLAGAIVTETVFAWPGLGRLIVGAILNRDFPIVRAGVAYIAIVIVFLNLVIDLLYTLLDPRIRYAS